MHERSFSSPRPSEPEFSAEPLLPKTEKIPVVDIQRIVQAASGVTRELRQEPRRRFSAGAYRSMLMSVLFSLADTSFFPQTLRDEIMNAELPTPWEKTHIELTPEGPRTVPDTDPDKLRMTAPGRDGVMARAQSRRQPLWGAYAANKIPPGEVAVVTRTDIPGLGEQGISIHQNREPIYENTRRLPEGAFLKTVDRFMHLEMGMLLKQKDLPVGENLAVAVDLAIERGMRRAIMEAKQQGMVQSGLVQADNQAMLLVIQIVEEYAVQHPGAHRGREYADLIDCVQERATAKRSGYSNDWSQPMDHDGSIPFDVMNRLATTRSFELFSPQEEAEREQWVGTLEHYQLEELLVPHCDWFVSHLPQLLQKPDQRIASNLWRSVDYVLNHTPGLDHRSRHKLERIQRMAALHGGLE